MKQHPTQNLSPLTNSVVLYDAQAQTWLHFHHPIRCVSTVDLADIPAVLESVQQGVEQGYYAAGFVSYEAAPAFDPSFQVKPDAVFPLAWFGLYPPPDPITLPTDSSILSAMALNWEPSIGRSHYQDAIQQIKAAIAQGLTYQVNFSFRLRSIVNDDPWHYFVQLAQAQAGLYGAFVHLDDWAICCASPELFFQLDQTQVICRPMKGTAPRGLTYGGDRQIANALRQSAKNQAENLMIVDMIRNDLGRIATLGTVQVPRLFDVEQYPTLWQMTSPIHCTTEASWAEIFQALFPCASITGAPKTSTMAIIAELEDSPRRIYTGTIGYLTPNRTAQFNVAIRTVLIDKTNQRAEYGVGGGIVWDSVDRSEYEECCTKAKVLGQAMPSFDLLESLLWTPEQGYFLLELHLQRLQDSAAYFDVPVHRREVELRLEAIAQTLSAVPHSAVPHKVRLCVAQSGQIQVAAAPLQDLPSPVRLGLAPRPINSQDIFLYHKTTHRLVYDQMKQACPDVDDVLLWNEQGEITESCIANIIFEWNGQRYTPPIHCGLLAGTMRSYLLQRGEIQERVLTMDELEDCTHLWVVNSVRRIQRVYKVWSDKVWSDKTCSDPDCNGERTCGTDIADGQTLVPS